MSKILKTYNRHWLLLVLVTLVVPFIFGACKLETSDNGDLDGRWYLREVEHWREGTVEEMKEKRIFWSFQVRMADFRNFSRNIFLFSRFDHKSDGTLRLYNFYINDHANSDPVLNDSTMELLQYVAVDSVDETYKVEALNSSTMVLSNDSLRLRFIKY